MTLDLPNAGHNLNLLEDRQGFVIAGAIFGSWGVGMLTGRYTQWRNDLKSFKPGLNNAQGSACHQSGSWIDNAAIEPIIEQGCNMLGARTLRWLSTGNKHLMNPKYTIYNLPNSQEIFDKEGYKITITVTLWDENGERILPWHNRDSCVLAMQTLLYDCRGENSDTRGGTYFYGHDGVMGYSVDPNCMSGPGKICPNPGQ
ncbi:MAG: hypothetical protein Q9181_004371 [Wetmoreana brouardii]